MHNQRERVNHARHRRLRARADIGRGAGDGAGCRQTAKHRRHDISDALPNQFDVRIVPVIAHAVRNHRRHQRFDRAQHGHGECGPQQAVDQVGCQNAESPGVAGRWEFRQIACQWFRPAA